MLTPAGQIEDNLKINKIDYRSVYGVPQFDNSEIGFYRGKRWLILLREFLFFCSSIFAVLKISKENYEAVHLNEISLIFFGVITKTIFSCPTIMHVRTLQNNKKNIRSKFISFLINKYIDQIICIDKRVLNSLDVYEIKVPVEVIRNSFVENKSKLTNKTSNNKVTKVGMVSNFLVYKGIFEFYEAAKILINDKKVEKIEFHIYGDNFREMNSFKGRLMQQFGFQTDIKKELEKRIEEDSLLDKFILKGFSNNLDEVYHNIDILCFPSHLNAVGRPVIEAAIYKKPSIVSLRDKEGNDYIVNNLTGLIVDEKNPGELANGIYKLHIDVKKRIMMGDKAFQHFEESFSYKKNSEKFIDVLSKFT